MTGLVTYAANGGSAVGLRAAGGIAPTGRRDMLELIQDGDEALAAARAAAEEHVQRGELVEAPRLLAPLRPGKLLFCGVNYPGHLEENPGAVLPEVPFFFSKLPSAVIGPDEPIAMPSPTTQLDYEVELAVVIGRHGRRVARDAALDHVFGYTVVNDVSARDVQFKDAQITLGKNADTFCPLGPAIVPADEIPDPQALTLGADVNGEQRQHDHTANMLFDVARLIEFVSATITLEPGDIVTTGTPAGVGCFRDPPLWLAPGDRVTVTVDGIGSLSNPVVAAW